MRSLYNSFRPLTCQFGQVVEMRYQILYSLKGQAIFLLQNKPKQLGCQDGLLVKH